MCASTPHAAGTVTKAAFAFAPSPYSFFLSPFPEWYGIGVLAGIYMALDLGVWFCSRETGSRGTPRYLKLIRRMTLNV